MIRGCGQKTLTDFLLIIVYIGELCTLVCMKSSVLDQLEADYHTLSERFRVILEKLLVECWSNLG